VGEESISVSTLPGRVNSSCDNEINRRGLYYYGARYYEPATSRWISPDPAGFELINPMESDGEGGWQPKQSYSVIEATNWYSYTSNNPVLYVDPTGEFMSPSKIKGYARNMIAGVAAMGVLAVADAAGQVGNFVSNLVTGDVEVSGSIGLQAGGGLIGGTLEVSKDGVNFTPSSSMTPEGAFEALQDFAGMPITIGVDGIETTFDAKVVKVGVSLTNDGGETMTLGIEAGADLFDALGVKAGVGVEASTQDGPFATLMNGKSEGMNKVAAEAIGVTKPESWLQ